MVLLFVTTGTFNWNNDLQCTAADLAVETTAFPQQYNIESGTDNTDLPSLDPYGIDFAYCSAVEEQREVLWYATHKKQFEAATTTQDQRDSAAIVQVSGVDPTDEHWVACLNNFVSTYLNDSAVLEALHVERSNTLGGR